MNTVLIIVYISVLIELLIISFQDVLNKKIYNYWIVLNFVAAAIVICLCCFLKNHCAYFSFSHILIPAVFFIVGFILFAARIVGAGDIKLILSVMLLTPTMFHEKFLISLLLSTILTGGLFFITTTIKKSKTILELILEKRFSGIVLIYGTKVSFAPIILLSWMILGWKVRGMFLQ